MSKAIIKKVKVQVSEKQKKEWEKEKEEFKRDAEKRLGKSWDEIMKQADRDTEKQRNTPDPIAHAAKMGNKSTKQFAKESLSVLHKALKKPKK